MNFATPKFNKAVADLKTLCGTHTQLFSHGQFYVTRRTMDDLFAYIAADLKANLRFVIGPEALPNILAFFRAKLSVPVMAVDVPSIMNMLNLVEVNGDMAAIRALFAPSKADDANALSDFNDAWSNSNLPAYPIYTGSSPTLHKARAAYKLEKSKCFVVLRSFAAKLLKKRGASALPPTVVLSEANVGGARPNQTAAGVPAAPGVAEIIARETLVYGQPAVLSSAAKRMRAAIDAGGFVHCGVLSGARHERSVFPNPEHHILVFAYDTIDGQDAFLFWDPDASRSDIAGTGWGQGFGVLFSRTGRLSTGTDDADLADIERTKNVLTEGDHLRDTRRHSYQVYTLQTLPLPASVKLHVKVLSPPKRASIDEMVDRAVTYYAANGLELIELSRESMDTPGTGFDRFQMLYVGGDPDGEPTADLGELHTILRQPRDFGVTPASTDIVIAFVDSMVPTQRGSSIHPLEQPGAVISSAHATEWTLAHEIGRVIGLLSSVAPGDLTYRSTASIGEDVPPLSDDNIEAMLTSPLIEV